MIDQRVFVIATFLWHLWYTYIRLESNVNSCIRRVWSWSVKLKRDEIRNAIRIFQGELLRMSSSHKRIWALSFWICPTRHWNVSKYSHTHIYKWTLFFIEWCPIFLLSSIATDGQLTTIRFFFTHFTKQGRLFPKKKDTKLESENGRERVRDEKTLWHLNTHFIFICIWFRLFSKLQINSNPAPITFLHFFGLLKRELNC